MADKIQIPKLNMELAKRKYSGFADEVSKNILEAYLIEGYSHRRIDREVLGLDEKKTRGFKSMGALHNWGIDGSFKGLFQGYTSTEIANTLSVDDSFHEICRILRLCDGIILPPLVKAKRKTEYNRYSLPVIREVVIQYLVEGKTHRQIDAEILHLDSKKTKGFQSFSVLNYIGLNGAFKGIAKSIGLNAIINMFAQSEEYSELLNILQEMTSDEHKIEMPTVDLSLEDTMDEDEFIELILTDYSLHGGKKK